MEGGTNIKAGLAQLQRSGRIPQSPMRPSITVENNKQISKTCHDIDGPAATQHMGLMYHPEDP